MTSNDFGDCSNQTFRTINFELKDSQGNDINLHGNNWSLNGIQIYSFLLCIFYKNVM